MEENKYQTDFLQSQKFEIGNLPNLKIKINSKEESEIVQKLFFLLGGGWVQGEPYEIKHTERKYLVFYPPSQKSHGLIASLPYDFEKHRNTEITLEELKGLFKQL